MDERVNDYGGRSMVRMKYRCLADHDHKPLSNNVADCTRTVIAHIYQVRTLFRKS